MKFAQLHTVFEKRDSTVSFGFSPCIAQQKLVRSPTSLLAISLHVVKLALTGWLPSWIFSRRSFVVFTRYFVTVCCIFVFRCIFVFTRRPVYVGGIFGSSSVSTFWQIWICFLLFAASLQGPVWPFSIVYYFQFCLSWLLILWYFRKCSEEVVMCVFSENLKSRMKLLQFSFSLYLILLNFEYDDECLYHLAFVFVFILNMTYFYFYFIWSLEVWSWQ